MYTAEKICNTSVQDAKSSLYHITAPADIEVLKKAVLYERSHMDRATMIRMLKAKIRQLEKAKGGRKS